MQPVFSGRQLPLPFGLHAPPEEPLLVALEPLVQPPPLPPCSPLSDSSLSGVLHLPGGVEPDVEPAAEPDPEFCAAPLAQFAWPSLPLPRPQSPVDEPELVVVDPDAVDPLEQLPCPPPCEPEVLPLNDPDEPPDVELVAPAPPLSNEGLNATP